MVVQPTLVDDSTEIPGKKALNGLESLSIANHT